jgi:hypothetical protein
MVGSEQDVEKSVRQHQKLVHRAVNRSRTL